jgi:hypothetical protein
MVVMVTVVMVVAMAAVVIAGVAVITMITMIGVTMIPVAPVIVTAAIIPVHVARNVLAVVPVIANEIHGTAAGVIFGAVAGPVALVAGGYVQVDRGAGILRIPVDDQGLGIQHRGWLRFIPDVDLSEESGLADADRNTHVARQHGRGEYQQGGRQKGFHGLLSRNTIAAGIIGRPPC